MDLLNNFGRIVSLEVGDRAFECVALRIGPTEVRYNFLVIDEEENEMIAPSAVIDYQMMAVADMFFGEEDNKSLRKECLKVWAEIEKALS